MIVGMSLSVMSLGCVCYRLNLCSRVWMLVVNFWIMVFSVGVCLDCFVECEVVGCLYEFGFL